MVIRFFQERPLFRVSFFSFSPRPGDGRPRRRPHLSSGGCARPATCRRSGRTAAGTTGARRTVSCTRLGGIGGRFVSVQCAPTTNACTVSCLTLKQQAVLNQGASCSNKQFREETGWILGVSENYRRLQLKCVGSACIFFFYKWKALLWYNCTGYNSYKAVLYQLTLVVATTSKECTDFA
jgi:hypothetical protein